MSFSGPSELERLSYCSSTAWQRCSFSLFSASSFKPQLFLFLILCAPPPPPPPLSLPSAAGRVGMEVPFLTRSPSLGLFSLRLFHGVPCALRSTSGPVVLCAGVVWCAPRRRPGLALPRRHLEPEPRSRFCEDRFENAQSCRPPGDSS